MRRPTEEEVIGEWLNLVEAMNVNQPKKLELDEIYDVWCPDESRDSRLSIQQRPELKAILKGALDGVMDEQSLKHTSIIHRSEYRKLAHMVDPHYKTVMTDSMIIKWCNYHIFSFEEDGWENEYNQLDDSRKTRLRVRFRKRYSTGKELSETNSKLERRINERERKEKKIVNLIASNPGAYEEESADLSIRREITSAASRVLEERKSMIGSIHKQLDTMVVKELLGQAMNSEDIPEWLLALPPNSDSSEILALLKPSKGEESRLERMIEIKNQISTIDKAILDKADSKNTEILQLADEKSKLARDARELRKQ